MFALISNSQQTRTKVLSAVQGVTSTAVPSLACEMKVFRRFAYVYGVPSWFYGEITEIASSRFFSRIPPGAMLQRPFRYRRSFMYSAVSDISYIVESGASWEVESGSVAKLWASNIGLCIAQFDSTYLKTRATTNVCLHVSTYCYETQHNQKLHIHSIIQGIGIRFTIVRSNNWKQTLPQHHHMY